MASKLKIYLLELRAPFFTASIIPMLLGAAIAWSRTGNFSWLLFVLTLLAGVLFHAGTNVANDYFDHLSGNDAANVEYVRPFTGGSRFIQENLLKPKEVLAFSLLLFTLGAIIGIYLVFRIGQGVLYLGVIGFLSGFFYSCPPIALVNRGIGEVVIGLNFGSLMTLGAYYVQTGEFTAEPLIASLPVAILIALVVFINQFQDMRADASVGKNHLVVRLGRKRASFWYAILLFLMYIYMVVISILGLLPRCTLIVLLTVPLALRAIRIARHNYEDLKALVPANALTIVLHGTVGTLITVGYVVERAMQ